MSAEKSHPLLVRGPDSTIEIPERLQSTDAIRDITRNRGRLSAQSYTVQEICRLLDKGDPIDVSQESIDLLKTIGQGHTILIQLMARKQWTIVCLLDMVKRGWSALETTSEGQIGIFHTGSQLPLGHMPAQYLIQDNQAVEIPELIDMQTRQPDIIAWRDSAL